MATHGERIVRLEVEVSELKIELRQINAKLDNLLALRNKGAGVFWLVSALVGTGVIGAFFDLFRFLGLGGK